MWRELVSAAVPGDERHPDVLERPDRHRCRRSAEGRRDLVLFDVVQELVEPGPAEDPDVGELHAVLASEELELDSFVELVSFLESEAGDDSDFEPESLEPEDSEDLVADAVFFDRLSVL